MNKAKKRYTQKGTHKKINNFKTFGRYIMIFLNKTLEIRKIKNTEGQQPTAKGNSRNSLAVKKHIR